MIVFLMVVCLFSGWGASGLSAGNLVAGAAGKSYYADMLRDIDSRIASLDKRIASLDATLEKDRNNKDALQSKQLLVQQRNDLKAARARCQKLDEANQQLRDAGSQSFVFDAPKGSQRTQTDRQADLFGIKLVQDFETNKAKTFRDLLQLEKSVLDIVNRDCYKNVPKEIKEECKKAASMMSSKIVDVFAKKLEPMKLEYVGIRKSLRGKDWMVFRLSEEPGDLNYWMISYTANKDETFCLGKLFVPASGEAAEDSVLFGMKKILDNSVGIPNDVFTLPSGKGEVIGKAFLNGNFKMIRNYFEEHPEYLWKNRIYDGFYVNSLQMLYNDDSDEEIGKCLKIAVEQYRKHYPESILPDVNLLSLFINKGDEDGFMACLDHLRESVIDDPAHWWFKSAYYGVRGDFAKAFSHAKSASQKGYFNADAYKLLLELFKQNNAPSEMKKSLEDIIDGNRKDAVPRFSPIG